MAATASTDDNVAVLHCGAYRIVFDRPRIMGILNITPDSFSDGGLLFEGGKPSLDKVLRRAQCMLAEGADCIDIGGESTRPRAPTVSSQEELERVLPVLELLRAEFDVPLSIDTSNPQLMREAGKRGAALINDVRALQRDGALQAVAGSNMAVCLMHMQGEPQDMQLAPEYTDVTAEVGNFLSTRAERCVANGIAAGRIMLDPGFGFGKNLQHNLTLFRNLPALLELNYPLLIGISRKSMIGSILGKDVAKRLTGGLALSALAAFHGVHMLRTHDIQATVDAVATTMAIKDLPNQ
ncbi:MAG: dihydropteroate synthase [Pseudomonadales bacterium]